MKVAAFLAPALLLTSSPAARASCANPPIEIIWSYPAEGATGVPTNARVFMLTYGGFFTGPLYVNGEVVDVDPQDTPFGWKPELQPNTHYVVETPSLGPSADLKLSVRFTTGPGPLSGALPAPPIVDRAVPMTTGQLSRTCGNALYVPGICLDTGVRPGHLVLETQSRPLFFVLDWRPPAVWPESSPRSSEPASPYRLHWPAECGHPLVFGGASCSGSYRVTAVGITGEAATADYDCAQSPPPPTAAPAGPPAEPAGGGCSLGPSGRASGLSGGPLLGLLGMLAWLWRRRR